MAYVFRKITKLNTVRLNLVSVRSPIMENNSENQFSKYILGNHICECQTFINTYTIVWYRLSKLKYKPNCPYNSKQLTFVVKAVRERVRSIIHPPPPPPPPPPTSTSLRMSE